MQYEVKLKNAISKLEKAKEDERLAEEALKNNRDDSKVVKLEYDLGKAQTARLEAEAVVRNLEENPEGNEDNQEDEIEAAKKEAEQALEDMNREAVVRDEDDEETSEEKDDENASENDELPEELKQAMAAVNDLMNKIAFYSPSLKKASKAEKKEKYTGDKIVTEQGVTRVSSELVKKRQDYLELNASRTAKKILKGKITGYHITGEENNSDATATIIAEVNYGSGAYTVQIPSFLLYYSEQPKHPTMEVRQQTELNVMKRIGTEVSFVVVYIDEKTETVYGDCLEANAQKMYRNYIKPTSDGRPRVIPDMRVEATIISISRGAVIVNALGAECRIPIQEASWLHHGDCRELFKKNQLVEVKILKVTPVEVTVGKNKYTLVNIEASIKQATPDPRAKDFPRYRINGRYAAKVTGISDNNVFAVFEGGKCDVKCAFPKFAPVPALNDDIIVQVTAIDKENLLLEGIIFTL